jgi:xanthine dehydrogenase accessory factor
VTVAAPQTPLYEVVRERLRSEVPVAVATVVACEEGLAEEEVARRLGAKLIVSASEEPLGSFADPNLDAVVQRDALGALSSGQSALRHYGLHGEAREETLTVFIQAFTPPPRMIILGAVDFSAALAAVAKVLGYRVTVCDARAVFATKQRFRAADEVVVEWPDRYLAREGGTLSGRDAVCVLTHDTKFDVPAIVGALATNVGYIGAMGSRRTKERRDVRLREAGVSDEELARVRAPIGLNIGARTPEETAISICAEIIAEQTGTIAVKPLAQDEGPIHRSVVATS